MFDFEKLQAYQKAKEFNTKIWKLIQIAAPDRLASDQLRRASFSVVLNIAEGSGRFSKADRRNFFTISRSSVFECIAILDILKEHGKLSEAEYNQIYSLGEEISRILFSMIRNLKQIAD